MKEAGGEWRGAEDVCALCLDEMGGGKLGKPMLKPLSEATLTSAPLQGSGLAQSSGLHTHFSF